jgi:Flp pilus assembly pilin Flp
MDTLFSYFTCLWICMTAPIRAQSRGAKGQGLVEYALIIGFIAIGAIVVLGIMSGKIADIFAQINGSLPGAPPPPAGP